MQFSVIVPTYNRRRELVRALKSVQAQTLEDFEVIVVDDGSADDPSSVVSSLGDPRFRCVVQENRGATAARNHGARLATGEYITFLDCDDEAQSMWLESLHYAFKALTPQIVCCGLEMTCDTPGIELQVPRVHLPKDMGPLFENVTGLFSYGGVFALRRTVFEEVGGYAEDLRSGQHTELAMRLIPLAMERGWAIHNIMKPLILKHEHAGPRIRNNPSAIFAGANYVLEKHKTLLAKDPKKHSNYHSVAGVNAARLGLFKEARKHLRRAALAQPFSLRPLLRMILAHCPGFMDRKWATSHQHSENLQSWGQND